jgi:ferredoxin
MRSFKMNKDFLIFIKKFKVPQKLNNHIHKILNEEEIIILNYLSDKEEKFSDIASKFPFLEFSLIESLYKKGYLIRQIKESVKYYKSNSFDQILKRFVNHNPKYQELHYKEKRMFQECISRMYLERMETSKKPVYRVVPIEKTLADKRQLISYQQAFFYLQRASVLALVDCICRTTFNKCNKPRKVCFALGKQAEFFIDRGIGEEIDNQRSLEILDITEKNGLVHSINNIEDPNFLCNCCECCCVFVQGLKKHGVFTSIGKSGFIALLNLEKCNQCEICVEKCIFEAISYEREEIKFMNDRCFGCGLCAYNCPQEAIKLILKEEIKVREKAHKGYRNL